MATITMKLEGFESTRRAVEQVPFRVFVRASVVIQRTTLTMEEAAKALAPVATGTLRNSITSESKGLEGGVGISGTEAYYWRFVEFGTQHATAQPFFRPAAENQLNQFIEDMRNIGPQIERDFESDARS